jgi:hypothetical protein
VTVSTLSSSSATLRELQDRVNSMQGRPAAQPLATHPAFAGLLQLRTGATYGVDSTSLAMALMAGPSAEGAWCAVVGLRAFGAEAAAAAGIELSRIVLVPDPADRWQEVASALIDVLTVVVLKPPTRVSAGAAAKLSARLRQRGAVLVVRGDWPRVDARLSLGDARWSGLGRGHGHLRARQVTVAVRSGTAPARTRRVWLPAADQMIRPVAAPARTIRKVS